MINSLNNDMKQKEGNATSNKKKWKLASKKFLFSLGTMVALAVICFTTNVILPFGKNTVVQAMSKAYGGPYKLWVGKEDMIPLQKQSPLTNSIKYKISFANIDFMNNKPKVEVPFNLEVEKNVQKSVDAGHSPWKLDPVFVSQVFVSLKHSPQGITGDYPIKTEELKLTEKNDKEAIVEVSGNKTPITKVYLERLVRPDSTGIWTVVGYDPK